MSTFFCCMPRVKLTTVVLADEPWAILVRPMHPPLAVNLNDGRTETLAPLEQYLDAAMRAAQNARILGAY